MNFFNAKSRTVATSLGCFLLCSNLSMGQVVTTVLEEGQSASNVIPYYPYQDIEPIILPELDIQATLHQDMEQGIEMPRFAVIIPTNFSKNDGTTEEQDEQTIWRMRFRSAGATSISFEMQDINLPEGTQMYVINKLGNMIFGPFDSKVLVENRFSTDYVKGEEATIIAIMPSSVFQSFKIKVSGVGHGFLSPDVQGRDYLLSQTCTIDVNCPVGAPYSNQRDATVLLLVGGVFFCSGTMMNDACQDFKSYLLTAHHCTLDNTRYDNWQFRFNYNSPNPTYPTCRGSEPGTWFTVYGSTLKADYAPSDFTLVELSQSLVGIPSVRYAGWRRTSAGPRKTLVGISHPRGDVKKISFTNQYGAVYSPTFWPVNPSTPTVNNHWVIYWSSGVTEGGSSGSALFDADKVIGQLHGHGFTSPDCADTATSPRYYGRLYDDWTGGGSSSDRLSDWLGAGGAFADPDSVGMIQSMIVTGNHAICTTASSCTLIYPNNGSVTWAVSPGTLFVSASGTGKTATLQAASSRSSGKAELIFTITTACGSELTAKYDLWVGPPVVSTDPIKGDNSLCINQEGSYYLDADLLSQFATVSWSYVGSLAWLQSNGGLAPYKAAGSPGNGLVTATITNACGTITPTFYFNVTSCFGRDVVNSIKVAPNPTDGYVEIEVEEEIWGDIGSLTEKPILFIYDKLGKVHLQKVMPDNHLQVDVSNLKTDIYFIEVVSEGRRIRNRMAITH